MPSCPLLIARTVRAAHLILTGYGHWLPNDPRGSGSTELRKPTLGELGTIHHGRKRLQPSRAALREFYRAAEPKLDHPVIWFDAQTRVALGRAVHHVVTERGYTCWALAILRNHLHAVVRTHRDTADVMLAKIADGTRDVLREKSLVASTHPVWSQRPYKVYLRTRAEILGRIEYVNNNPMKERLASQRWRCVSAFEG